MAMTSMKLLLPTLGAATLVAALQDAEAPGTAETGSIQGVVRGKGDLPPARPPLEIREQDAEGCSCGEGGELDATDRTLLIDEESRGVANVVLSFRIEGVERKIPEEPVFLDQKGCRFEPHVVVVPAGGKLRVGNSDETAHNVHCYSRKNRPVNKTIAAGATLTLHLKQPETFPVKCHMHPWMGSWIVVTDATHWAKTDVQGRFEIAGLPPGTYALSWWHEELGKGRTDAVVVEAGRATELTHDVKAPPKKKPGRRP